MPPRRERPEATCLGHSPRKSPVRCDRPVRCRRSLRCDRLRMTGPRRRLAPERDGLDSSVGGPVGQVGGTAEYHRVA